MRPVAAGLVALSLSLAPLMVRAQEPTPATQPAAEPASPAQAPASVPDEPQAQVAPNDPLAQPAPENPDQTLQDEVQLPLPDLTVIPTLVPMPKDPPEVQEVEVPSKPVAILSGQSKWEDNFATLSDAFKKINAALDKAGVKSAGRPVVVYTQYTDDGFSYDAMIPLAEAPPADAAPLGDGIRYGTVPGGKALRFVHTDAYSEISDTYEAAGLYIETRDLVSKEMQIEEWVTDITDPAAKGAVVNLYIELQDKPPAKEPPKDPPNDPPKDPQ